MEYKKVCVYCGKMFIAKRKHAKTCSRNCRVGLSISKNASSFGSVSEIIENNINVNHLIENNTTKKNYLTSEFVNENTSYLIHDNYLYIRLIEWNKNEFGNNDFITELYKQIKEKINDFLFIEGKEANNIDTYNNMLYLFVKAECFDYWLYSGIEYEIMQGFSIMTGLNDEDYTDDEDTPFSEYKEFANNNKLSYNEVINKWQVINIT